MFTSVSVCLFSVRQVSQALATLDPDGADSPVGQISILQIIATLSGERTGCIRESDEGPNLCLSTEGKGSLIT